METNAFSTIGKVHMTSDDLKVNLVYNAHEDDAEVEEAPPHPIPEPPAEDALLDVAAQLHRHIELINFSVHSWRAQMGVHQSKFTRIRMLESAKR